MFVRIQIGPFIHCFKIGNGLEFVHKYAANPNCNRMQCGRMARATSRQGSFKTAGEIGILKGADEVSLIRQEFEGACEGAAPVWYLMLSACRGYSSSSVPPPKSLAPTTYFLQCK